MRAKRLSELLEKNDRVAVSNITGREASKVSVVSQQYAGNIVGGWALGKGTQTIEVPGRDNIPVFPTCAELYATLPKSKRPNKALIYSPPEAVYGEVKEVIQHGGKQLQTIFVVTENVSIEVTAKIRSLCNDSGIDAIGCNTLGVINTHDHVRVGAVGGDNPEESFVPGSATIISNSGNMVNTIAAYMQSAGIGTHLGISTGKDVLILTPLVEYLKLAAASEKTRMIILYVEPGGLYEKEAVEWMKKTKFKIPVLVYVAGQLGDEGQISLGHAGAVVEGHETTASAKADLFDEYFGVEPFDPRAHFGNGTAAAKEMRGIRVTTLHHLPQAAKALLKAMKWKPDFPVRHSLELNPWFVNLRGLADNLPASLHVVPGKIPEPYNGQFSRQMKKALGHSPAQRSMRNASHASSLDEVCRLYGYSVPELMESRSFGEALILCWTGELPVHKYEAKLVDMCLTAALTNGPGTISAQGAKLSTSAGNSPNTAMIASLASMGDVHGGNGRKGIRYLLKIFLKTDLADPYSEDPGIDLKALALKTAKKFKKTKDAAKESGVDYERIPCLGHPVFNTKPVNYDPRERVITKAMQEDGFRNVFLDFYHELTAALHEVGVAKSVWAVNMDAVLAAVWLGICWVPLMEKRITQARVEDCAFLSFALGRSGGGAGEFLDHRDYGTPMDMRIPADECKPLTRPRDLP